MNIELRRPHAAALVLGACAVLFSSCGNSRIANRDTAGGGSSGTNGTPQRVIPAAGEGQAVEVRVDQPGRISVGVKVLNSNGTPSAGLVGEDFRIFEDGVLVSQSESFQQIRPRPQAFRSYVHLILDRSNSVQSQGSAQVEASARAFIDLVMPVTEATSSTFVRISWFAGTPDLEPIPGHDIGFSNDRQALLDAIDDLNLEDPGSVSTNLYGAVDQGLDALDVADQEAQALDVLNRALTLVTFTDGTHQTGGPLTPQGLRDKIDAGATLGTPYSAFTIGVGQEIDPAVLALLGPDGSVQAAQFAVLSAAFQSVGEQVRALANSFYNLTYCSPKRGGPATLTIAVVNQPTADNSVSVTFNSDGFGSGCAFLDDIGHGEALAAPGERFEVTGSVELPGGGVAICGWRSADCVEVGCGQRTRAFVARFLASDETAMAAEVRDGRLDPDFGQGGVVALGTALPTVDVSGATSVALDPGTGELIVGGWTRADEQSGFSAAALWRVSPDGSAVSRVDITPAGGVDEAITSVVRIPDTGDIIAGGYRGSGSRSTMLWRLFPSLQLDAGFGSGGAASFPGTPEAGIGRDVTLVAAGSDRVYAVVEADDRVRVIAFNQLTGGLDLGFGQGGVATAPSAFGGLDHDCRPGDAVLDSSGRLVIGGAYRDLASGGRDQPAIWRLLDTGEADVAFRSSPASPSADTGIATLRSSLTSTETRDFGLDTRINGVTIAPDGTILATGERRNGSDTDLVTFAFDAQGRSEGDYNLVGFVIHDGAASDNSDDAATLVRVLESGAIWCIGTSRSAAGDDGDVPTVWVDRDRSRAYEPLRSYQPPTEGSGE